LRSDYCRSLKKLETIPFNRLEKMFDKIAEEDSSTSFASIATPMRLPSSLRAIPIKTEDCQNNCSFMAILDEFLAILDEDYPDEKPKLHEAARLNNTKWNQ
jgi:hypothetical protein